MPRDVIYVPGLPASELYDNAAPGGRKKIYPRTLRRLRELFGKKLDERLLGPKSLTDPDPIDAGDPIDGTKLLIVDQKHAQSLYDHLVADCGLKQKQIHKVGWDWRRPAADERAKKRLEDAIAKAPQGSVVVVHSTGGMVVRSVLENNPALCGRLHAVLAFGVPWTGTLKSFGVLVEELSLTAATKKVGQKVMARSWAAIDLMPRENAGFTVKGNGQPYDLFDVPSWLPATPQWLREAVGSKLQHSLDTIGSPDGKWTLPVDLHNVAGFGVETAVSARIVGDKVQLNVTGSGADLEFDEQRHGDGTIPFGSAAAAKGTSVSSWIVPIGSYRTMGKKKHGSIWSNPGGVKALKHVVADEARESLTELCLDTSAYSPGTKIRLRYSVFGADGQPAPGQITITTPASSRNVNTFQTDSDGFGTLVLSRLKFHSFQQGSEKKRRIRAELLNTADGSTSDIFALVPA